MSTTEQLRERYRLMTDDQLLQLSNEGGLLPDAASALRSEMESRKLSSSQAAEYAGFVSHQQLQMKYQEKGLSTL